MIIDVLENHALYVPLAERLPAAFKFLTETDLVALPAGRFDLDGDRLYVMVQEYLPKSPDQGKWEAHRKYIDVQHMVRGREHMGYANLGSMALGEYLEDRDFQAMSVVETRPGNTVEVSAGQFVIFFPQDAHKPSIWHGPEPEAVKKVVLKVRI